jgi:hypothetical protein
LVQVTFGDRADERLPQHDLGFELDERRTLRHLAMYVSEAQYDTLQAAYKAQLRQQVEAGVPQPQWGSIHLPPHSDIVKEPRSRRPLDDATAAASKRGAVQIP